MTQEAADSSSLTNALQLSTRQVSKRAVLFLLRLVLAIGLSTTSSFAYAIGPQLNLDTVNVKQEGTADFSALLLGPDAISDFPSPRFNSGETGDQSFRLYVDLDSIHQITFNGFTLSAYVVDERATAPMTFKFQVTGSPNGTFADLATRVYFHVIDGRVTSTGWILMPVYNGTKTELLKMKGQNDLEYVSVSRPSQIQISLESLPDTLTVYVTDVSSTKDCQSCWLKVSSAVTDKNPLTVDPTTKALLPVDFVPNSVPALMQSALIVKTDVPHDTVTLTVTYHTYPGGAARKQTIPVKVRFNPALWALALALVGGVVLGLIARYLLNGKLGKDNESGLHAIFAALVFGFIGEVIGVLLTSFGNSKLVLFDLNLDPRQVFPAFILAVLISGGSTVVSWMQGIFGKSHD